MAEPTDSKEFDPSTERRVRVHSYDDGYSYRTGEKKKAHLAQSSAAQLAICLASDSSPELLEERMQGKEVDLDTDLAEFLTVEERKFLPAATYIVEGLREIDRIEAREAFESAQNSIAVDRMGTAP